MSTESWQVGQCRCKKQTDASILRRICVTHGTLRFCRRKLAWKNTFESSIRAVLFQIPGGKEFHHALCHGRRLEGGSEDNRNREAVARGKSGVGAVAGGRMHADGRLEAAERERRERP